MSVSDKLTKEVKGISLMAIVIVVFIIVLTKFKDVDGVDATLNTTIETVKGAIDEPITWIAIIIIIIVVGWLMSYLKGKKGGM
jgi:type IV secretory pathway VirB2 component (pilin)